MAERNVNVRLQVVDGGKVKAELKSVGQEGAAALDVLSNRSQQAGAAVNRLATHEVTNLAAQFSDLGVQLASGQSPFMALIQQGPQIGAILGDRGIKGAVGALGQGLLALLTPTNLALAGMVAVGYAGAFAFEAIFGKTEDATEALKRHDALMREVSKAYGDAAKAAEDFATRSRAGLIADLETDLRKQRALLEEQSKALASSFGNQTFNRAGPGSFVIFDRFKPFTEAIEAFRASVRAGTPDVEALREAVARTMNAADDPAIKEAGAEIRAGGEAAAGAQSRFEEAAGSLDKVNAAASGAAMSVKELVKAVTTFAGNEDYIAKLRQQLETVGDARQQAIDRALEGRKGETATQAAEIADLVGRIYDKEQADKAVEKSARDARTEQKRLNDELKRAGEEVYRETRTAAELYGEEIEHLSDLLAKGRIDQETYGRAAAKAAEDLAEAQRAALDAATDAGSGFERAVRDYLDAARDMASQTEDLLTDALQAGEDAFVEFATKGKIEVSSLVDSIRADLARIAYRQAISGLLGAIAPGLGGLFGSGAASAGPVAAGASMFGSPIYHAGGLVGAGGAPLRNVPLELFRHAERLHGGGFIGPDERPAILQVGERVQSRAEVAAEASRPRLNVVVNNYTDSRVSVREDERGNLRVEVEADKLNARAVSRPGSYTGRALGAAYGMRPNVRKF